MGNFDGSIYIGGVRTRSETVFRGFDPALGEALPGDFCEASAAHVDQACALANQAFDEYRETSLSARADFLRAIADEIAEYGEAVIDRAHLETGLPIPRLTGELVRTTGQLRLFADIVQKGEWLDVTIDVALPDRQPLPRPDIRLRKIAIGPVAVFGASNFPLAFSVAGGDTAAALAAGSPVVFKGHPAHPGTGELVAQAILDAAKKCGMPDGVFSYLPGTSHALGAALVENAHIMAVAFTGSRSGGLALMKLAASRPVPIPVYAEMSSINPVYLMQGALKERAADLASAFVGSLMMGAGQFCTNPGLIVGQAGADFDRFVAGAKAALGEAYATPMLTPNIANNYKVGTDKAAAQKNVSLVGQSKEGVWVNAPVSKLFQCPAESFLANQELGEEIFGASSLIVECSDFEQMQHVSRALEGQLTATIHMTDADIDDARLLLPILERKVGRILVGGWPTGVEVCHAMVHGGPFPATSNPQTTSVGSLAIHRFLRPLSYQGFPAALLPPSLRDENPLGVSRRIDGELIGISPV